MNVNNFFKDLDESILDPIHKELCKEIWNNNQRLKTDVKKHILDHLEEWLSLYTDKVPEKIYLAGSLTGFQYTQYSDVDVNVIIDLADDKVKALSKFLPNGKNLPGTKHPVNYYITNKHQLKKAGSLYDMSHDKWIREPARDDINIHYKAVLEIALSWMKKVDLDVGELHRDVLEYKLYKHYLEEQKELEVDIDEIKDYIVVKESEIRADIDAIHITYHMIKQFRSEPFQEKEFKSDFLTQVDAINANYSINNIVYKTLERFNYLDKLHEYSQLTFETALKLK